MKKNSLAHDLARAPARAMLKATGLTDEDLAKPRVAVVHCWTDVTPCNMGLKDLAQEVRRGIKEAGGMSIEFNTVAVSDGITMGTEGMRLSLMSREVIADSLELAVRAHEFDAVVALCGCDKTIPGVVMGLFVWISPLLFYTGAPFFLVGLKERRNHPRRLRSGGFGSRRSNESRPFESARRQCMPRELALAAASSPPTPCPLQ